jgi:hypothetical protein
MKVSASLLLVVLVAVAPTVLGQSVTRPADLAGVYRTGHEFGAGDFVLHVDGTFQQDEGSDDGTRVKTTGTFQANDGKLLFSISKCIGRDRHDREFDLLDPKERQMIVGFADREKEFSMFAIRWSERLYLIRESDMQRFADAVNMGIEPRNALFSLSWKDSPWMGSFYLRSGDEEKRTTGRPPLPQFWSEMLLASPVAGKVIRIDKFEKITEEYDEFTATINLGSRNGLKTGMKLLLPGHGEPSPWSGPEVISLQPRTAQIKVRIFRNKLKIGDVVSSKYRGLRLAR